MTSYRDLIEVKECARCGSTKRLEVHHKNLSNFYEDDHVESNLIVLCIYCHRNLHKKNWKLEDIGIVTPKERTNPTKATYYNNGIEDIQKELEAMGDPITDIMQWD